VAYAIEGAAKDMIHPQMVAPDGLVTPSYAYDTGALKASITAVTFEGSDFNENVAAAAALRPEATFGDEETLSGPLEAAVQAPINYAGYVEFGGSGPAQPFLTPATELVASQGEQIAREVFGI